jgi:hypothetical protein
LDIVEAILAVDSTQTDACSQVRQHYEAQGSVFIYVATFTALQAGNTALHRAAAYGQPHVVRRLIEAGSDLDCVNDEGACCACMRAWECWLPCGGCMILSSCHCLLYFICCICIHHRSAAGCIAGATALSRACRWGHADAAAELLAANADETIADEAGRTPLEWARAKGHDEVVALFQRPPRKSM